MMKLLAALFLTMAIVVPSHARQPASAITQAAAEHGSALPSDSVYQLPLKLTDQDGKTWDWRSRRGKPQVVAMFYASCRYICPLIIESGKGVDRALTPKERAGLGVLFISMDPERDTPAVLKQLAKDRKVSDPRWAFTSPKPADVRSVAGVLDVRYRQLSDGEFNHTSALVLLDADGRILARTEKMGSQVDPEFLAAVKAAL